MPDLFENLPDADEDQELDPGGQRTTKRRTTLCVTASTHAGVVVATPGVSQTRRTRYIFDAAGLAITGDNGQVEFSLNEELGGLPKEILTGLDIHVAASFDGYEQPVNVVATADRGKPAVVTTRAKFTEGKADVLIRLFSWDVDGSPKPDVKVRWRCNVPIQSDLPTVD